jgi:hypothetical protein
VTLHWSLPRVCLVCVAVMAVLGDCVRRRRWYRKRVPLEGRIKSLFMLGATKEASSVHVKTEDARDWSAEVPLRSLGTHGLIEVQCPAASSLFGCASSC